MASEARGSIQRVTRSFRRSLEASASSLRPERVAALLCYFDETLLRARPGNDASARPADEGFSH